MKNLLKTRFRAISAARRPRVKPLAGVALAAAICSADSPRSIRSIRSCIFAEKSRISTAVTSLIMPRPYCAAAPESCRSWVTPTLVPRPARARTAVTTMLAWPRPRSSAPLACTTTLLAALSRSVMSAVPANCSLTGPIRTATRPLYFSPPRSSVSSAPGRQVATCGMFSKNCHTFSTGSATSKSLLISIVPRSCSQELLHVSSWFALERLPAAGAAEVVRNAGMLQRHALRPGSDGHTADRIDLLGRLPLYRLPLYGLPLCRLPLCRLPLCAGAAGISARQRAGRSELDELGQDRDCDLLVGGAAEVKPGWHPDALELVLRDSAVGEISEHGHAALARAHEAKVSRTGRDRALQQALVVVSLARHDDHGKLV